MKPSQPRITDPLNLLVAIAGRFPDMHPEDLLTKTRGTSSREGNFPTFRDIAASACKHSLGPLLYHIIRNEPSQYQSDVGMLAGYYYRNVSRHTKIEQSIAPFFHALDTRGIPVLPLKGIVLAEKYYPTPPLRTMDDVDILVMPDDAAETERLALEHGFRHKMDPLQRERYRREVHHLAPLVHEESGFDLEIHTSPLEAGTRYGFDGPALMARSVPGTILGENVRILSPGDFLTLQAMHFIGQVRTRLINIADFSVLLASEGLFVSSPEIIGPAEEANVLPEFLMVAAAALSFSGRLEEDNEMLSLLEVNTRWRLLRHDIGTGKLISRERWFSDELTDRIGMTPASAALFRYGRGVSFRWSIAGRHLFKRAFPGVTYIRNRYGIPKGAWVRTTVAATTRPLRLAASLASWWRTEYHRGRGIRR